MIGSDPISSSAFSDPTTVPAIHVSNLEDESDFLDKKDTTSMAGACNSDVESSTERDSSPKTTHLSDGDGKETPTFHFKERPQI